MTVFKTALKRIFTQPFNWVLLLIFPVIFTILINLTGDTSADSDVAYSFGVCDQDRSILSETLVKQMEKRYHIREVAEEDISAVLTDSEVPWILMIREGYARDVLAGQAPELEGHSLKVSEVSALASVNAESITRSLVLLGTDDPAALAAWEENAAVELTTLPGDNWDQISFWFAMYGFVSIFVSFFVVKALSDDKLRGMPDRLGVLPMTPRRTLAQSALAAFCAVEITAALLVGIVQWQLGSVPNPLHMFLLLSLYNLFAVSMIIAIMSIARNMETVTVCMTMLSVIIAMLGGLFWPLEFAPEFMKKVAWFSPGYWLSRGLENMKDITFEGFGMPMLFLAAFAAVALLLGGWKRIQPIEA